MWSYSEYRKIHRTLWVDESQALMWQESYKDGSTSLTCQGKASMNNMIHLK